MNTYRFIFESFVTEVRAATLGQAYQILEQERAVNEQKLRTVECVRTHHYSNLKDLKS